MADIGAIEFYRHYGFTGWIDAPKTLFLPIEIVIKAAKGQGSSYQVASCHFDRGEES